MFQLLTADLAHADYSAHSIVTKPIIIGPQAQDNKGKLLACFERQGFVIVETKDLNAGPETVIWLSEHLNLGEPFVPGYMNATNEIDRQKGINRIGVPKGEAVAKHKAFSFTNESPFHTDGTAQPIGMVKTSIVHCEQNAASDGLSTFFNVNGAFRELYNTNPDAADALFAANSLTRGTFDVEPPDVHEGPVLSIGENGMIISRFSIDHVSRWNLYVPNLQEALGFMKRAAEPGSKWHTQLALKPNQSVILANSRIAHGRTAYENSAEQERVMWRGLFLEEPS